MARRKKMDTYQFDLDNLKKEIWYLKTKTIPDLYSSLKNTTGGDLTTTVYNLKQKVSALEDSVDKVSDEIDDIKTTTSTISQLKEDVESLSQTATELASSITSLTTNMESVNTYISENNDNINKLIESDSTMNASIEKLATSHETRLSNLEETNASYEKRITTIEENNSSITDSINALNDKVGNSQGLTIDVIYDMRSDDSTINQGYTTGIIGGSSLNFDFSNYRAINVYATLNSNDCQKIITLTNRNKYDFTFVGASSTLKIYNFMRAQIPSTLNRLIVGSYASITYNSTTSALSVDYGTKSTSFFVYRIEGIK
jgi:chaperonin cofactor prefoldin